MRIFFVTLIFITGFGSMATELSNIRTAKDGSKYRIVIDLDGQKEPAFYVKKAKDKIYLTIEASVNEQRIPEFIKVLEKTNNIEKVELMAFNKEKEVILAFSTNPTQKISEEIFALPNPSRVVIDVE